MIEANAGGIERSRVRKTTCVLRRVAIRGYRSIRYRVRVQERCQCRWCTLSRRNGRDLIDQRCRQTQSRAFVGNEKEGSALQDRSSYKTAEIVVMFSGAPQPGLIREPIVCVHHGISEIVEDTTVPVVRSRTRGQHHLPARLT